MCDAQLGAAPGGVHVGGGGDECAGALLDVCECICWMCMCVFERVVCVHRMNSGAGAFVVSDIRALKGVEGVFSLQIQDVNADGLLDIGYVPSKLLCVFLE